MSGFEGFPPPQGSGGSGGGYGEGDDPTFGDVTADSLVLDASTGGGNVALNFAGSGKGWYSHVTGGWAFSTGSIGKVLISDSRLRLASDMLFSFGSGNNVDTTAGDTFIRRSAASTLTVDADGAGAAATLAVSTVRAGNGTAGAPAYSFSGDTDTGLYGSTGNLFFAVAGSEKARFNTTSLRMSANLDGNANILFGFVRNTEANTAVAAAPNVLNTGADLQKVLTNEGATAENHHDLPTAAAGLTYTFVVQDADGMQINAASGDTIRIAGTVSSSGGFVSSTTVGDSLTLVAINATEWVATAVGGNNWTFDT